MKRIIVGFMSLLLILSACTPAQRSEYQRFDQSTFDAGFDTVIRLIAYTKDRQEFDDYFEQMTIDFFYLNTLFDKYNDYEGINNIKTINDNAGVAPVEVDPFIIDLLKMSKYWYDNGEQLMDVTFGAVLNIWHDYRELGLAENNDGNGGPIPSVNILEEAAQCTGFEFLEINEEESTVFLTQSCASLDVGATAKGYATEVVARSLESAGMKYGLLSAGGNVRSINTRDDGEAWGVGIELPEMFSQRSADTLRIPSSISIVTSGDYQRYYEGVDGNRYHHLINPRTLFPESYFHSVTAVTEDSGIADALSTILFLMDYDEGINFINKIQSENPDELIGAFWIFHKDQEAPTNAIIAESEGYMVAITESLIPYSRVFNP